jgi:hypothetical protein
VERIKENGAGADDERCSIRRRRREMLLLLLETSRRMHRSGEKAQRLQNDNRQAPVPLQSRQAAAS